MTAPRSVWRSVVRPAQAGDAGNVGPADAGSIIVLILGFFLVALLMVAGSIAAGDAFIQQRGLQSVCDGAAAAAAASAVDLDRAAPPGRGELARFGELESVVLRYLATDPGRAGVTVRADLSSDRTTLTLYCAQTTSIAFGTMFGKGAGVHHTATSSARAPLS